MKPMFSWVWEHMEGEVLSHLGGPWMTHWIYVEGEKRHAMEKSRCATKHSDESEACVTWKGKDLTGFSVHAKEKQGMRLDCRVGQDSTMVKIISVFRRRKNSTLHHRSLLMSGMTLIYFYEVKWGNIYMAPS